jgi:hypothetical protein
VFADAVIGPGESGGSSAILTCDFEVSGPANTYATVDITKGTLYPDQAAESMTTH